MRSVNQNHHLYVITANGTVANVTKNSAVGSIFPYATDAGMGKDIYFKYMGRDGLTKSDMIPVDQINYAKWVTAGAMETPLKQVTIILDSAINEGKPVVGQDYILNIAFQQFYGLSPEDTYVKTVAVRATSKMDTAEKLFTEMVKELKASFSREVGANAEENPYLTFEVDEVTDPNNPKSTINVLIITEVPQDKNWSLGKWEMESLVFDVFPSTIYVDGIETEWGTATPGVSNQTVPNGKRMADLEWFTYGERADHYRGMGYPNNFNFTPLVDPSVAYDALEIHFAYQGSCEDIQKSEKDITIIGPTAKISTLVTELQKATFLGANSIVKVPKD